MTAEWPDKLHRTKAVVFDPNDNLEAGYVEHRLGPLKIVITGYVQVREDAKKSMDDFAKEQKICR